MPGMTSARGGESSEMRMEARILIAALVCLALTACEPRGTPQKPKTIEHADMIQPSAFAQSGFGSVT